MGMADEVASIFGRRVRVLRTTKGMTQEQLGQAAKIDYKHISAIERGASPSFDSIGKLARALGVDYWELFVPDNRPTNGIENEINVALAQANRIKPQDMEQFLRALRSAIRKLDRNAIGHV